MNRQTQPQPRRDARFLDAYRDESVRMHALPPEKRSCAGSQPQQRDAAVILPLLLLLMTEGADRYLLLALLYILM